MELVFASATAAVVVAGLAVELRLFAPGRAPLRTEAIAWSIATASSNHPVAMGIALTGGPAGEWTTVYMIERSLSLDNVFLFSLLLAYFLEEGKGAKIRITFDDARRGSYEVDATADEAAELGRKGRQVAWRGRKPKGS